MLRVVVVRSFREEGKPGRAGVDEIAVSVYELFPGRTAVGSEGTAAPT